MEPMNPLNLKSLTSGIGTLLSETHPSNTESPEITNERAPPLMISTEVRLTQFMKSSLEKISPGLPKDAKQMVASFKPVFLKQAFPGTKEGWEVILSRAVQFSNAETPRLRVPNVVSISPFTAMVTVFRAVHPLNAASPTVVTESGMETVFRAVHPSNSLAGMAVTPSSITMDSRAFPLNTSAAMEVTA